MKERYMVRWILVLVCALPLLGNAQREGRGLRNEIQMSVGLNSYQAFELEPSYCYMFHKNIGVVGGIRGVGEVVDNLRYDWVPSPVYRWELVGRKKATAVLLRPAIRLKLPIINQGIAIVAEPGVLLNPMPYESLEFAYVSTETIAFPTKRQTIRNKGSQVAFFDMKTYLSVPIDNWGILFGYGLSTFDLYSGRRNIVIEGDPLSAHLPAKRKCTHTGFIGVNYCF